MVSNSQKVLLTDGHLLESEAPRGGRGDRENEDSVHMIQHQDKPVGEKSQMVTWTVNELTFEQPLHATLTWFVVWQTRNFS